MHQNKRSRSAEYAQRLSLIREFINGLWLKGKSEGNIAFAYSQTLLAIIGDLRNEIAKEADSHYS